MVRIIGLYRALMRAQPAPQSQQSAEVRDSLVKALYASSSSLLSGALAGGSASIVVAYQAQLTSITVIAALICCVGLLRSISAVYFEKQLAHHEGPAQPIWGYAYELGAWAYAALLGMLAFVTLLMTKDAVLHMLSVSIVAAYSGGISGRNAGRVHVAVGQTCFALLPTSLGLTLVGGISYMMLAILCFLMIFAMAEITRTTHRIVLDALTGKYEKGELARKYEKLARFDSLTGIENRMAMQMRLRELLDSRRSVAEPMAVLWMDLDRFKEINDSLGHIIGDQLLCMVAERLSSALGDRGHVSRFGGDEFILLCPNADRPTAVGIGNDIMAEFEREFDVGGHHLMVSASMGLAIAPRDGLDGDELLQHSDMALYQAKHEGRHRMAHFDWRLKERQNRVYKLERELRTAIANGEMAVHYQPIFGTESGEITVCEALLRWKHPTLGDISPAEFIPIAESNSAIEPLTAWVLEQACLDAMHWSDQIRVAVNISPSLIKSDGLPRAVIAALMASGLPARRLELELTESIFLEESDRTNLMLTQLQRIGLRLAMDDFGTGYSSLGYLRKHAFDTIKVDQSFMRGVGANPRDRLIVQTVAELARALNVETVAEGIETAAQFRFAHETGFTNVQGFFLARPMPADELAEQMERMKNGLQQIPRLFGNSRRA